ncbi:MAG: alcohol dehydrogenase catalytic domain-containing protein [Acidobacteriota bacterium]|nr:alcohol dehydrogenase catalytic domain-containing protein [Acidobacteriota bacterium]
MNADGPDSAPSMHSSARIPHTMRAVLLRKFGGPELLKLENVSAPDPTALDNDEVLIRVRACGVCYHDIINRRGDLPRTDVPLILGHEIAGDVVAVGENVERFSPGDRVACVQRAHCNTCEICQNNRPTLCKNGSFIGEQIPGGYAEYAVVPTHALSEIPPSIPYAEASICACTIGTAIHVAQRGRVTKEDRVLITGASGGVGLHAIQVCKLSGANVIAITSSPEKVEHLRQAGADEVLVAPDLQFTRSVKTLTKGHGVDVVLEIIGSLAFEESVRSLAVGGRLVMVGNLETRPVDFMPGLMILKELEFIGSYATTPDELTEAFRLVEAGSIKPMLAATLPLAEAAQAHKMLFERGVTGRLALEI